MGILDIFRRKPAETRSSGAGYTAQVIQARHAAISGAGGMAELTATAQGCISLWEGAFSMADCSAPDLLTRRHMALIARSMALRGEVILWMDGARLVPAFDWEILTKNSEPRAYRLGIPETGGGRSFTALPGEVIHLRTGADLTAPWSGTSPLRRSSLTSDLMHTLESALLDVYRNAPLGSQVLPVPEGSAEDMAEMRASFRGRRGQTMVFEGVAQSTAAGMNPQLGQKREDLSPDLQRAMTRESLEQARSAILMAFGVLPAMANASATGPVIREAQRHLAQWTLQPLAELLAEEATAKLGAPVQIDLMRPLQAFDTGGKARALGAIIKALAEAKEQGIDPAQALALVDWKGTQTE
ncbi:phage portal protein [Roseinatronobacter alkalisoli]|uniref:Phage portal protein n=1 Tax=Roseinatronobacter alkalisoli TaxID=3028235 RepID=A0ABT5T523_9RHOB|nr:phage portal protein [Roseinatronobacter sp. HJB301]MDD7970213.1 phage portal protein [Roseinatronobacter sp. HJB301]